MIVGIIGATGYAGAELTRLLSGHPKIDKILLSSISFEGERMEDVYPNFLGIVTSKLLKPEEVIASSDVVFSALPHAVGESYAAACMERKIHFIDLSADFRFDDDEETYKTWYDTPYKFPELHKKSVYGLPELNRERAKLAAKEPAIIANPGCYPTAATLGILPALSNGLCGDVTPIIINAVSGISGGGREPSRMFHYPECADSIVPYKIASHRHSPEIARNLAAAAKKNGVSAPSVIFTPHLAPMNRGILCTIYIPLPAETKTNAGKVHEIYKDFYKDEPFVRILPLGVNAAVNRVRHSNYCDISVCVDSNSSTLIAVTAIDNMIKGAAGQAVQNMNILFDFEETTGLGMIPMLF